MSTKWEKQLKGLGFTQNQISRVYANPLLLKKINDFSNRGGNFIDTKPSAPDTAEYDSTTGNIAITKNSHYISYDTLAHELAHALGSKQTEDHSSAKNYSYSRGICEAEAILYEYKVLKAEQQTNGGISQDTIMTNTDELDMQGDSLYKKIEQMKANGKSEDEILKYLAHENRHKMIPSGEIATYHQEDIWWYLESYSNIIKDYSEISSATLDITNPDIIKMIDYDLFGDDNDFDDVIDAKNSKNQLKTQSLNGSAFMYGGSGDDTLTGTNFADIIIGGKGTDILKGENGNDILGGNADTDYLYGGEGDDTLKGGAGTDYLYGEENNDDLYGGDDSDELYGGTGDDYLDGGDGSDKLDGGDDKDTLVGGYTVKDDGGHDELYGGDGNDTLIGGLRMLHNDTQTDILQGGDGFDTYYADSHDIIEDSDGKGRVYLAVNNQDILLTGGSHKIPYEDNIYKSDDDKITYEWDKDNNTLYVSEENSEEKLTINNWQNGELGIDLSDGMDIAFVVDVSGSMQDDVDAVKARLNDILDVIYKPESEVDNRVAVATYETDTTILQEFTDHDSIDERKQAITQAIDQMSKMIDGGTENLYHALYDTLTGEAGEWRGSDVTKKILLIGDEPGDDRDIANQIYAVANDLKVNVNINTMRAVSGVTSYNVSFYNQDNPEQPPLKVSIDPIMIGYDPTTNVVFNEIANKTDGDIYHVNGAGDLVDAIIKAVSPPKRDPYHIIGTDEDETLTENSRDYNLIDGMAGDDTITLNKEGNDANGGTGNDDVRVNGNNNTVNGNEGDDYIKVNGSNNTVYGNEGNDYISINQSDNIAFGNEGNDTVYVSDANNVKVNGGEGDDRFSIRESQNIRLEGGVGYDTYDMFKNALQYKDNNNKNVVINDIDATGNLYIDSANTYIKWSSKMSSSVIPKLKEDAEFIEDNVYKLSNNNRRIGTITYDVVEKSFYYNRNTKTNDFDFKIENFDYDAFANNMNVTVSPITFNNVEFQSNTFSLQDFIRQGRIISTYSEDADIIHNLGTYKHGQDEIYAKGGDDTIIMHTINQGHRISAGSGNDTIYTYDDSDSTNTELGNSAWIDIYYGGEGNDKIFGNKQYRRSEIYAEDGDDVITTTHTFGKVYGGDGNDTITVENQAYAKVEGYYPSISMDYPEILLDGGDGDDIITAQGAFIKGGAGNDILQSLSSNIMDGGAGADTLIGGNGNDTYIVDELDTYTESGKDLEGGYDTIHIASDFDLSQNNFEAVTLLGTEDFNALGDQFDNIINGNAGNNHLDGKAGADIMVGGAGDDYYIVDQYETLLTNADGTISLQQGDQVVEGILKDNYVHGDTGGNDTIEQWDDHRFYSQDDNGNWIDTDSYHHLQTNVENLILKGQAKTAFGNELDNIITLNEQNNFANAQTGDDTIIFKKGGGQDVILSTDNIEATDTIVIDGYNLDDAVFIRRENTNSVHDMLTINFKNSTDSITLIDYFTPTNDINNFDFAQEQDIIKDWLMNNTDNPENLMINNKIDQLIFKNNSEETIINQQQIENTIINQADNHAPTVNKNPQAVTITEGDNINIQLDSDTIIDQDTWDNELDYTITTANQQPIPDWLTFDPTTLTLTGTTGSEQIGTHQFIIWGKDLFEHSAGTYLTINIQASSDDNTDDNDTSNPTDPTDDPIDNEDPSGDDATNDTIHDTSGNDTLAGGDGNDTYIYTAGQDVLIDTKGVDKLIFSNGITFNQVGSGLMQSGNDLILRVNGDSNNQITLTNYFSDYNSIIETIEFETGGSISHTQIFGLFGKAIPDAPTDSSTDSPTNDTQLDDNSGSDNADNTSGNDIIGTSANDNLTGTADNNRLQGLSGDDTLDGNSGNDIIIAGKGNDILIGGEGNDLYYIESGFGNDTIINTGGGIDNIYFDGLGFNDIASGLQKSGDDLILNISNSTDSLTLQDFFEGGEHAELNIGFESASYSISAEQLLGAFGKSNPDASNKHTQTEYQSSLSTMLNLMDEFGVLANEGSGVI